MFCQKCGGIEDVVKVYETDDFSPRLCDVKCLNCGEIRYSQAYDFGHTLNLVVGKNESKGNKE